MKRRLTELSRAHVAGLTEAVVKGFWPINNWMYWRSKGWWPVLAPLQKYYLGLSRKKKLIQAGSLIAFWNSDPPLQVLLRYWSTETGIGRTQVGRGYFIMNVASCFTRKKSMFPNLLFQGLPAPTAANICSMEQRYCSMDRFLIGIFLASIRLAI